MIDHHVSHAARRSVTYLRNAWTLHGDVKLKYRKAVTLLHRIHPVR